MDSKVSKNAEQDLVALTQRLTPEDRVKRVVGSLPFADGSVRSRPAVAHPRERQDP
jgi:hypothetical protein